MCCCELGHRLADCIQGADIHACATFRALPVADYGFAVLDFDCPLRANICAGPASVTCVTIDNDHSVTTFVPVFVPFSAVDDGGPVEGEGVALCWSASDTGLMVIRISGPLLEAGFEIPPKGDFEEAVAVANWVLEIRFGHTGFQGSEICSRPAYSAKLRWSREAFNSGACVRLA